MFLFSFFSLDVLINCRLLQPHGTKSGFAQSEQILPLFLPQWRHLTVRNNVLRNKNIQWKFVCFSQRVISSKQCSFCLHAVFMRSLLTNFASSQTAFAVIPSLRIWFTTEHMTPLPFYSAFWVVVAGTELRTQSQTPQESFSVTGQHAYCRVSRSSVPTLLWMKHSFYLHLKSVVTLDMRSSDFPSFGKTWSRTWQSRADLKALISSSTMWFFSEK